MSPRLSPEAMAIVERDYRPKIKDQPVREKNTPPGAGKEVVRVLRRPRPSFEGWSETERGLPFNNGRLRIIVNKLDGRGKPTGETEVIASFTAQNLADSCRDRINQQNPAFSARVEKDTRKSLGLDADGILRTWPNEVPMQTSPWCVTASLLDEHKLWTGGGIVAYFENEASAKTCADEINRINPAHEAKMEIDEDFVP
ncbi:MAG: hypothetical protein V1664_03920 [Candidatus Uhrbacteria bacterium]